VLNHANPFLDGEGQYSNPLTDGLAFLGGCMRFPSTPVARLLVGLTLVLAPSAVSVALGCGSTETVTVTEESSPPETVIEEAPAPKQKKKSRAAAEPEDSLGGQEGNAGVVPDLVGVDHQLAQDTLQSEGYYFIEETDCSGQDRLLLWDRNWTVVEQTPPGGTEASVDDTVTLCSVKDGEE
jgi:hypothetical protein